MCGRFTRMYTWPDQIGTRRIPGNQLRVDIIVKFVIDIVVALVMGIANFIVEAALKLFAFGYGIFAVVVTCLLLWQGIAFIRRYRKS